jgi:AcrR family transcriptional regulator
MGSKERRDREREAVRDKILRAARDLFAKKGYEEVTMRGIARRIEYTPTALYHHFPSKQALVTELCRRDLQMLAEHLSSKTPERDPLQRIVRIGEAYLRFAEQYPSQYRFLFMTTLPSLTSKRSGRNPPPEAAGYAVLRAACQVAIDQGCLRKEFTDVDEVAQLMWAPLHGLISLHLVKKERGWVPLCDLRDTARRLMEVLVRGVARDAAGD